MRSNGAMEELSSVILKVDERFRNIGFVWNEDDDTLKVIGSLETCTEWMGEKRRES